MEDPYDTAKTRMVVSATSYISEPMGVANDLQKTSHTAAAATVVKSETDVTQNRDGAAFLRVTHGKAQEKEKAEFRVDATQMNDSYPGYIRPKPTPKYVSHNASARIHSYIKASKSERSLIHYEGALSRPDYRSPFLRPGLHTVETSHFPWEGFGKRMPPSA